MSNSSQTRTRNVARMSLRTSAKAGVAAAALAAGLAPRSGASRLRASRSKESTNKSSGSNPTEYGQSL